MVKNTYVVAPNFTTAPPPLIPRPSDPPGPADALSKAFSSAAGRVQLGDVLVNPFGAELRAINRQDRTPVDVNLVDEPTNHGGISETRASLLSGRLGLWASLLASMGLGASVNISIHAESRSSDLLEAKALWTRTLDVSDGYVEAVLRSASVKKHLGKYPRAKLYMVTGLKIVNGAKMSSSDGVKVGGDAGASDDAGIVDLKLLSLLWNRSRRSSFKNSSDFILAVQLRYIKLDKDGELLKHAVSETHATMADGERPLDEVDPALLYNGTTEDLAPAKATFGRDIYQKTGEDGDEIILPDIEFDDDE